MWLDVIIRLNPATYIFNVGRTKGIVRITLFTGVCPYLCAERIQQHKRVESSTTRFHGHVIVVRARSKHARLNDIGEVFDDWTGLFRRKATQGWLVSVSLYQ
jgi:hypothetical protein